MKKSDLIFTAVLVPLDYLMLILAGLTVYVLRFHALSELRPVIFELKFWYYFKIILMVGLCWLPIFIINGLYRIGRQRFSQELVKIFSSVTVGIMIIVLFIFFKREFFSSRFIVLAGWLVAIIFVSLGRLLNHFIYLNSFKRGVGLEPIIVVGQSSLSNQIIESIQHDKGLGYKVLDNPKTATEMLEKWSPRAKEIKILIQGDPSLSKDEVMKLVDFCNEHQVVFRYMADPFGALLNNIKVETLAGIPLIEIKRTALDGWGRIIKRFCDLFVSIILFILFLPLLIIIALLIKIDSSGPILVALTRVGQRGRTFKLYKFRSMVNNAHELKTELLNYSEREGPLFKMQNDPRVTKLGKFLRKWSIDEIPQLINAMKGEMSLVGPRPHEPEEVAQYHKNHKQLLTIKPGITGLAQISGRSTLSFDEEAKLDIYYIEHWSPGFDLQVLVKTIPVVLSRKNAA